MARDTIDAHAMYFINTGKFYAEHKLMRDALEMFPEGGPELADYLDEIALSVFHWIEWHKDYAYSFRGSEVTRPTRGQRREIALRILDHWTDGKLTEQLEALV